MDPLHPRRLGGSSQCTAPWAEREPAKPIRGFRADVRGQRQPPRHHGAAPPPAGHRHQQPGQLHPGGGHTTALGDLGRRLQTGRDAVEAAKPGELGMERHPRVHSSYAGCLQGQLCFHPPADREDAGGAQSDAEVAR